MKIAYTRPEDGGLSIVIGTDDATPEQVWKGVPADAINPREMSDAESTPADRIFRKAWKDIGAAVEEDLVKSREVLRGELRGDREAGFPSLDAEHFIAIEANDTALIDAIGVRKKVLRNSPADVRIDAAPDIPALKAARVAIRADIVTAVTRNGAGGSGGNGRGVGNRPIATPQEV